MYNHYFFLAMDLARERAAEADRYRLASEARQGSPSVSPARQLIARAAVAVARAADRSTVEGGASAS